MISILNYAAHLKAERQKQEVFPLAGWLSKPLLEPGLGPAEDRSMEQNLSLTLVAILSYQPWLAALQGELQEEASLGLEHKWIMWTLPFMCLLKYHSNLRTFLALRIFLLLILKEKVCHLLVLFPGDCNSLCWDQAVSRCQELNLDLAWVGQGPKHLGHLLLPFPSF